MISLTLVIILGAFTIGADAGGKVCKSDWPEYILYDKGDIANMEYPYWSPMYVEVYCYHTIVAPHGKYIDLTIDSVFTYASYYGCYGGDTLLIFDHHGGGPPMSYLCGGHVDDNRWLKPTLTVAYHAYYGMVFHGYFHTVDKHPCGDDLTTHRGSEGVVTSPGYPGIYYNNERCVQEIYVHKGNCIVLTFEFLDLEYGHGHHGSSCMYDYIEIFDDQARGKGSSLGYFCGSETPDPITSTTGYMKIFFETNSMTGLLGFKAHWKEWFVPYDFTPVPVKGSPRQTVYFELRTMTGVRIMDLSSIKEDCWEFTAEANHMDACGACYTIYGTFDNATGLVKFDLDFLPGHYEIEYRAEAVGYDFRRKFTAEIMSKELWALSKKLEAKTACVDFVIYENYDHFHGEKLEQLRRNIRGYLQLKYAKDVFVTYVEFMRRNDGYIDVRAELRGDGLKVTLRKACSAIATPEPIRLCWMGSIIPIQHSRTMRVYGKDYGHMAQTPCSNAMFT